MKVGFLGLGVMGYPMAGHLAVHGHEVSVYNRTARKAEQFVEEYSKKAEIAPRAYARPREASKGCDIVMACVGRDDDLREVTLGEDGAFAGMEKGSIFVDHTTASLFVAQELGSIAGEKGLSFVDAPVSGGEAGAQNGVLTVMAGGDDKAIETAKPVIFSFAKKCERIGDVGSGQLAKMVNQICIAGLVQGLSEALSFGHKAGLDMEKVVEVISGGAAQSWQMDNRAKTMLAGEFDFGFAVEWMRKDLGIVLDTAKMNGASLPVTAMVDQFYAQIIARGGKRWDTSSLIDLLQRKA